MIAPGRLRRLPDWRVILDRRSLQEDISRDEKYSFPVTWSKEFFT